MRNILIFYWASENSPLTVKEHIEAICSVSNFRFTLVNTNDRNLNSLLSKMLSKFMFKQYDYVIYHNTVSYDSDYLERLLRNVKLRRGVKRILFKQDEMIRVNHTKSLIKEFDFKALVTCISKEEIKKVYFESEFTDLEFCHVHTGYISEGTKSFYLETRNRTLKDIDVFYRGMYTPFEWGQLSYDKAFIGDEFVSQLSKRNNPLKIDISSNTSDRVYGNDWVNLLCRSKSVLGVESGASIFDFDGSVKRAVQLYLQQNPEADFFEVKDKILEKYEGNVYYGQISPRHLETCLAGAVPVMFEGRYSDVFVPNQNYIVLNKDYSNLEEVIDKIQDESLLSSIVKTNDTQILKNDKLNYTHFTKKIEDLLNKI